MYGNNDDGFTVLELMIATTMFTVILLLCTYGLVEIGKIYYKGIITSRTQTVARGVIDSVSQTIQFSGSDTMQSIPNTAYCFGNTRYTYQINNRVSSTGNALLLEDIGTNPCSSGASTVRKELLGEGMRLTRFNITQLGGNYFQVNIGIAYGEDDVLNLSLASPDYGLCIGNIGNQFCSTSSVSTTVFKRIN